MIQLEEQEMSKLGQTTELNISKFGFKHKHCNNLR